MSDNGSQQPRPAYFEEYSEETQAALPETKQSANIAAKITAPKVGKYKYLRDEQSDSGYSSHTHSAPNSSLDSKVEAQTNPVVQAAIEHSDEIAARTHKASSRVPSPDKNGLQRAQSKGRRRDESRKRACPCNKCIADAQRTTVQPNTQRSSNHGYAQPAQRAPNPPSAYAKRVPVQPEAVMAPRQHSRPRPSLSRPRPMSFHAGAVPEQYYMSQPPYMVEQQQPPVRQAAYPYMAQPFQPQPSYHESYEAFVAPTLQPQPQLHPQPQPQASYMDYFPPGQIMYEVLPQARPRPRRSENDQYRSRPQSMYYGSPPIIEQREPRFTVVEPDPPMERQLSRRARRDSLRAPDLKSENDRMMMPPPPAPKLEQKVRQERPPMRHATTAAADYANPSVQPRRESHSSATASPVKGRESRKGSLEDQPQSRRPSMARSSKTSDEKVVSFDEIERGVSRMSLDKQPSDSRSRRRSSVYGHESLEDLEGSIEAYQQSKGTVRSASSVPSQEDMLVRLVRKKTNTNSETGSRASAQSHASKRSRDGNEAKYAASTKALDRRSSKDASSRTENDRFSLRFNPADTNIKMQGAIDGGAINLRKPKDGDGDMELSFESRQGQDAARGRLGSVSNRAPTREKSRKRYSIVEGRGVQEISGPGYEIDRSLSIARTQSPADEGGRRIVGERIVTTVRSRRSSRYGYDGRERYDQ